jgi:hypothetical protein
MDASRRQFFARSAERRLHDLDDASTTAAIQSAVAGLPNDITVHRRRDR